MSLVNGSLCPQASRDPPRPRYRPVRQRSANISRRCYFVSKKDYFSDFCRSSKIELLFQRVTMDFDQNSFAFPRLSSTLLIKAVWRDIAMLSNDLSPSRRSVLRGSAVGGVALATTAFEALDVAPAVAEETPRSGAIGYTSFIHPKAYVGTAFFAIGAQSLIEGQVQLQGASARLGNSSDLQDNCRLQNFGNFPGDLVIGDGSFTAHNVTFIGRVVVGDAVGTVISAVVQNAIIGDASIVGFTAQILGTNPFAPIRIPDAHLVLFGARIKSQADVAANTIPIPAAFSLFASDVNSENVLLARAYNLLYRAAGRFTPFSSGPTDPGNPGGKLSRPRHRLRQVHGRAADAGSARHRRHPGAPSLAQRSGLPSLSAFDTARDAQHTRARQGWRRRSSL